MKIRSDFVSNSSSSSFIVWKKMLNDEQKTSIKNLKDFSIGETKHFIIGHTIMDNLKIEKFLLGLGIPHYEMHIDTHIGWCFQDFLNEVMGEEIDDSDYERWPDEIGAVG